MGKKHIPENLAAARLKACRAWPYASHAILSMIPIPRKGLGTVAVDQYWRMYFDPAFCEQQDAACLAGIVMHEVSHLLLKHHKRGQSYVSKENVVGWNLWNVATDAAVNQMVLRSGGVLPEGHITAAGLDLPDGLAAEQYYRLLKQRQEDEQDEQQSEQSEQSGGEQSEGGDSQEENGCGADDPSDSGDGCSDSEGQSDGEDPGGTESQAGDYDGQDGDTDGGAGTGNGAGDSQGVSETWQGEPLEPGTSGSCCDGQPREWELPAPTDDGSGSPQDVPGLQEWEQEVICRNVAERCEKQCGAGEGGSWQRMIDEMLHPRLDPKRLLMKAVAKAMGTLQNGDGRFSYRRPSRRPSLGGTIRPRAFQPVPRISVIIDTSGSMSEREMALGVGLVSKVLNSLRLRDGIHVITGDVGSAWAAKVFDPSKIELRGGGGTDMGALVVDCSKQKAAIRPELIVVVTDGITPWPQQDVGIPVVACITDKRTWEPPAWIERVDIWEGA